MDSNNRCGTNSFGKKMNFHHSENCFWTISFSAALIQGTAGGEEITPPLQKNELKTEPYANSWRKMTSWYYVTSYCIHTEEEREQILIIPTAFQTELQSSKTACWILSEKREQGVWNTKSKHSYRCTDAPSSWVWMKLWAWKYSEEYIWEMMKLR